MFPLLFSLLLQSDALALSGEAASDSIRTDTLREVVVRPDSVLPIVKAIDESLKRNPVPRVMTVGDVLEKLLPGINDKITHPFAIKQRKKERRHKKLMKALEDYDRVESFDELLRKAYQQQMMEDSLELLRKKTADGR